LHWLCDHHNIKPKDGGKFVKGYLDQYKIKEKGGKEKKPKEVTKNHNAMILKKYYKVVYDLKINYKCNHIGEGEELHDMVTFNEMKALV